MRFVAKIFGTGKAVLPTVKAAPRHASPWVAASLLLLAAPSLVPAAIEVDTLGGGPIALGGPSFGYLDGDTLQRAQFHNPFGCAVDSKGNLFVADRDNGAIRKLDIVGNVTRTFVSGLSQPVAVAVDTQGNIFAANQGDGTVQTFDAFGNFVSSAAGFTQPSALAFDGLTKMIYVTELGGAVKRLSPDGQVTTVTTGFAQPRGVAVIDARTLAISENHAIRRLNLETLQAEYLAGTNVAGYVNGPGAMARFNLPHHLARAPNGDILVADRLNHCVRGVHANGQTRTIYGIRSDQWVSDFPGWLDGSVEIAEAREPVGVTANPSGRIFATEVFYHIIRTIGTTLVDTNAATNSVSVPIITPSGAATNNPLIITLSSDTQGAELWYRVALNPEDVSLPDPTSEDSLRYIGPFALRTSGTLFARGFKAGFFPSELARADFKLTVADPAITPQGANSSNTVLVIFSSATSDAELRWTIDGSEPTPASPVYTGPFVLGTNGTLKVKGFRDGFTPSQTISAEFHLLVGAPEVTPNSGTFINELTVKMSSATTNATLRYTLDGTEPTDASPAYTVPFQLRTNATLKVAGVLDGFVPAPLLTRDFTVQVDKPTMTPDRGFFPAGTLVTLNVQRADATIYFTVNGQDPTPHDQRYVGPFKVFSPAGDLRSLRARAFAPDTEPSEVVSGRPVEANTIGVPRDFFAGVGSTVVVPVVVNLTTNDLLRSLQFRVEVAASSPGAPALTRNLRLLDISPNNFIPVAGPAEPGASVRVTSSVYTDAQTLGQGLAISAVGTNAGFVVRNFATVALLGVDIPPTAHVGDVYQVTLLEPSGTADGQQQTVPLTTLPTRTITVANATYVVGDSSLGIWYNAGEFGDGQLDNSDVNNAFSASLGVGTPFPFTDLFNAMDAFPPDVAGSAGGDGQIRFLDWQVILRRSLRLDGKNWQRAWTDGGVRVPVTATLPGVQALRPAGSQVALPGNIWYRQALLGADNFGNAEPNSAVGVPVYVTLVPGASLSGLQFRAAITPQENTPPLLGTVEFVPAVGVPAPQSASGLGPNEVAIGWGLDAFSPPARAALVGSNVLGTLRFRVPITAAAGACYTVSFSFADGAPDLDTQYDFETRRACVYVLAPAPATPDPISDEWRVRFFGRVDSVPAGMNADPDGDGLSNLAEYLAGTNPMENDPKVAGARLQLLPPETRTVGGQPTIAVRWLSASGRTYVVESTDDITAPNWTVLADNHPGDGQVTEVLDPHPPNTPRFYRLRLAP